jgi:hypothetical protein
MQTEIESTEIESKLNALLLQNVNSQNAAAHDAGNEQISFMWLYSIP